MNSDLTINEIAIADDHPIFRTGIRRIVQKEFPGADIREAGTYEELLAVATDHALDLFLLDLDFPGFEATRDLTELRSLNMTASVIVISMSDDKASVMKVMAAGADGFISKAINPNQLANAIKKILQGHIEIVTANTLLEEEDNSLTVLYEALPNRQREILRLITQGLSNKEIARELDISPYTVRIHVSNLFRSLHVGSRSAAAAYGADLGL